MTLGFDRTVKHITKLIMTITITVRSVVRKLTEKYFTRKKVEQMIDEKKFLEEENNMIDARKIYKYIKAEINPYGKPFEGTVFEFGCKVMDYIEAMEKQPKTDWIPCEERLPSESGKYLVTEMVRTALRKYYTVGSSYFNGETWHSDFKGKFGGKDIGRTVIAWQPLPQPYKKEGAE